MPESLSFRLSNHVARGCCFLVLLYQAGCCGLLCSAAAISPCKPLRQEATMGAGVYRISVSNMVCCCDQPTTFELCMCDTCHMLHTYGLVPFWPIMSWLCHSAIGLDGLRLIQLGPVLIASKGLYIYIYIYITITVVSLSKHFAMRQVN